MIDSSKANDDTLREKMSRQLTPREDRTFVLKALLERAEASRALIHF
jgi:hypothetical protein